MFQLKCLSTGFIALANNLTQPGSEMKFLFFLFSNYYTNVLAFLPHEGNAEEFFS